MDRLQHLAPSPGPGSLPVTAALHRSAARDQATLFITAARSHTCPGVTLGHNADIVHLVNGPISTQWPVR